MLGGNVLHHVLAGVAAVVVGRACQFVLHLAVEQHQTIAIGLEGEVLELAAATVEAHQTASLSEDRSKLVHDAAVDAAVVVLSSLTSQHHIPLAHLVLSEDVVETAGETALHSG